MLHTRLMATPIITDGSLDRVRKTPRVVLPVRQNIFSDRATRFVSVASGNAMSGYLQLMAKVSQAQQAALAQRPAEAVSEGADREREYGRRRARNERALAAMARDLADIVATTEQSKTAEGCAATLGALDEGAQNRCRPACWPALRR